MLKINDEKPLGVVLDNPMHETRKRDHIELARNAQISPNMVDSRFCYEPLLGAHPNKKTDLSVSFLQKKLKAPLWISSMTGGVGEARHINLNLARLCREMGLGMGLGSCRSLLSSDLYFEDFNLRPIIGPDQPFFANFGIAQIEKMILEGSTQKILELCKKLDVDGLFIHVNPLQEWLQPEGDVITVSPIETIKKFCDIKNKSPFKLIVKEVGQGMGPSSLKALFDLPIDAFELAGFGGTNFSKLEALRGDSAMPGSSSGLSRDCLTRVGHTPEEMIHFINRLSESHPKFQSIPLIISGGIDNFLDGHYLRLLSKNPSVYGHANKFLSHALNYEELEKFTADQISGLMVAQSFLTLKETL